MRVLTDPVETGAATISIPQDVQAEAHDWPESLFAERTWHVARPLPERSVIARAADVIRSARKPLIVAGGGVIYSDATEALAAFCEKTGIPVGQSQAGKGSLPYDHPQSVGAIGSTGTTAANALATEADVVIGIGTRYSDFTSASRTAFNNPDVRFVNVNVASIDSVKQGGVSVVSDAREAIEALGVALGDYSVSDEYRTRTAELAQEWDDTVSAVYKLDDGAALNQNQVIGLANTLSDPRDVVVCAAGSMPGDLHKLWRTRDRKGYHVEYGFSCMGYEVAGGIGAKMAEPDRDVFIMVGDGSYLMMATELVTAVQENVKVIVVLVQNHGFASIGSLSEALGSQRFGTSYRYRSDDGRLDGAKLPVDLAANAASLGADVIRVVTAAEFTDAVKVAKASDRTTVIHVETDPLIPAPDSESWWDVPVSETSTLESTQAAYADLRRLEEDPASASSAPLTAERQYPREQQLEQDSGRIRPRLLGRLVSRRPEPDPVHPLPRRGRRIRLRVDRAGPLRLPADRPQAAVRRTRGTQPEALGGNGFRTSAPGRLLGRGVEADRGRRQADRRRRRQARRRHPRDVA